jgi:hypothetical protein
MNVDGDAKLVRHEADEMKPFFILYKVFFILFRIVISLPAVHSSSWRFITLYSFFNIKLLSGLHFFDNRKKKEKDFILNCHIFIDV